jgi:undecaprenyl pyrophosphate phosphatase UppP
LLRYLRTHTLLPFIVYRYGLAVLTLVIAGIRVA